MNLSFEVSSPASYIVVERTLTLISAPFKTPNFDSETSHIFSKSKIFSRTRLNKYHFWFNYYSGGPINDIRNLPHSQNTAYK